MKNILRKGSLLLCVFVFAGALVLGKDKKVYAVEFGGRFLEPEEGWQRIDDSNPYIKYDGPWNYTSNGDSKYQYNLTWHATNPGESGSKITFKFKGTKFRIIGACNNGQGGWIGSTEVAVNVDGYRQYNMSCFRDLQHICLLYNLQGLDNNIHTVTLTNLTSNFVWFDAIDIDKDGQLLDANSVKVESLKLNETSLDMNIKESKNLTATVLPANADNKGVKWISSDNNVCTVDENGKVTAVGDGKAVVTAVTKDGSNLSQSCNIKVIDENNRGVLNVYMNDGKQFTYNLNMSEVKDFTEWFNNREQGKGRAFYIINSKGKENYTSHTDCLKYDSIAYYTLDTYRGQ